MELRVADQVNYHRQQRCVGSPSGGPLHTVFATTSQLSRHNNCRAQIVPAKSLQSSAGQCSLSEQQAPMITGRSGRSMRPRQWP